MAFPYILETNFEAGTNGEWTAETDTGSQLDFPHVSELARYPWSNCAPYRGAYCARWVLGANTTAAYLNSTAIDIADAATASYRWYMYIAPDFVFTADDVVSLFKLRQAGAGTVEFTVGMNCVAATGVITLGASDGVAAATFGTTPLPRNEWFCIEVTATLSTGASGAITTFLNGVQQSTQTGQTEAAAVGDGELGITDRLSTTTGTILMDDFVNDDLRLYPFAARWPQRLLMTKSSTVFLGPGRITNCSLLSGSAADSVLRIYDTSLANVNNADNVVLELKNTVAAEVVDPADTPIDVVRGCYVQLSGTAPRALLALCHGAGYGSSAVARRAGLLATGATV